MTIKKIRWGVLGTGRIIGKAGTALTRASNGIWLGVAGRNEESSRNAAEKYGVPRAYAGYEELLADPDIDAVYIALLNHLHKEWAVKACKAGKHVLVEKPFAMNAEDAREMAEAAEQYGVRIKEAHVWHYYEGIAEIRKRLHDGSIGEWIHLHGHYSFIPDAYSTRWHAAWGGGSLYDIGCYLVAWARYFTGEEPLAVEAGTRMHPVHQIDESFVGTMYFADGKTAQIGSFFNTAQGAYFEVFGTAGTMRVDFRATPEVLNLVFTLNGQEQHFSMIRIDSFRQQAEHFAESIISGDSETQLADHAGEAIRQAVVMDALWEAAAKKSRVWLQQPANDKIE
ncbi:Gfo/Idh/MocA family protein [Paenibacillus allorhizosphaerae]|uniref:Glucose--fructose oxidoreductase n=1 Tax=Paenibacillus allorhizosphaerae TaxID=2849866 RepID=A0ABM8VEA8_9BACL|nr:Gfo/Idh/MocA family oxidoreductase [Paenibacillus allorhizosphaerae]CAG7630739.1 Glucose--fructose oxidoreductase [Paenibacillus allorhizosphaerae]